MTAQRGDRGGGLPGLGMLVVTIEQNSCQLDNPRVTSQNRGTYIRQFGRIL